MLTGSQVLFRILEQENVDTIFDYPGGRRKDHIQSKHQKKEDKFSRHRSPLVIFLPKPAHIVKAIISLIYPDTPDTP